MNGDRNNTGAAGKIKSNQIIFIGLRSSKNYYKRPGSGVGIWEGSVGCEFFAWVDVC